MRRVMEKVGQGKKKRVLKPVAVLSREEYQGLEVNGRVEAIQSLMQLGLMAVQEEMEREVEHLAGALRSRVPHGKDLVRYGSNPGSVKLAGQRVGIRVPRVRNQPRGSEVPLESYQKFRQQSGEVQEQLVKQVLYGLSCRNYESASQKLPETIGMSASSISREFIEATAQRLKEFQQRDLSGLDLVALWLDGKSFAEDTLVIAVGLTMQGEKIPLGFVQAGTENESVLGAFLEELIHRGLQVEQGLLVVLDGGKGLRAAVKKVFQHRALVQRCQWHKRENVVGYLAKSEQSAMRKKLQRAYEKATYTEARTELNRILKSLQQTNLSAAKSLQEGLEETLTLHRLGCFTKVGISLKTTNGIESLLSQVERYCRKVTYWKNSSQKQRWLASALMDIEPRLNRVKGYQHLRLLREAIQKELNISRQIQVA